MSGMKSSISESRKKRGAPKGFHPVKEWKPGQSGNPAGGIRKAMSWAEASRFVNSLTPAELRTLIKQAGGSTEMDSALSRMPQGMVMKVLTSMAVSIRNVCEPSPGLIDYTANREDGKVPDKLHVESDEHVVFYIPEKLPAPK